MEKTPFTTPIPPFNQFKAEQFVPALNQALARAEAKVNEIADNPEPPTIANTLVKMDGLFTESHGIQAILAILYTTVSTPEINAANQQCEEISSAFSKKVFQNPKLAARFKALQLPENDEETQQLYKQFTFAFEGEGAFLNEQGQERIKQIDARLIALANAFTQNVKEATQANTLLVTEEESLSGASQSMLEAFRESAEEAGHKQGWLVVPDRLLVENLLEVADNRQFRKDILTALDTIGTKEPYNNRPLIAEMLALRQERAALLGYPHYAAYALKRTMAGSLPRAQQMLQTLAETMLPRLESNLETITAYAQANGGPSKLEPHDAIYWANRYKAATFGYDSAKLAEYLPLESVIEGFFTTAEKLFGVTFKANPQYPVYHPTVIGYDVYRDGLHIGIMYGDYYSRKEKQGGAWMMSVKPRLPGQLPVVTLNMNLLPPTGNNPTLVSPDQSETFFHEGGHALHGLLGTETKYIGLQGTGPSSDYLEFHSTVMENWARQRESLSTFARHHATGQPVPKELLEAKEKSSGFFEEALELRIIQNAMRDLAFHQTQPQDYKGDTATQDAADFKHPAARSLRAYPFARFGHLFSDALSQYAAGYYGYMWSRVLAANGFEKFRRKGLYDSATAKSMAKLYEYGASRDTNRVFEEFNGGPIQPQALFREMGIEPRQSSMER